MASHVRSCGGRCPEPWGPEPPLLSILVNTCSDPRQLALQTIPLAPTFLAFVQHDSLPSLPVPFGFSKVTLGGDFRET